MDLSDLNWSLGAAILLVGIMAHLAIWPRKQPETTWTWSWSCDKCRFKVTATNDEMMKVVRDEHNKKRHPEE